MVYCVVLIPFLVFKIALGTMGSKAEFSGKMGEGSFKPPVAWQSPKRKEALFHFLTLEKV